MPKRGKTRKQKVLADLRRKTSLPLEPTATVTVSIDNLEPQVRLTPTVSNLEVAKKPVATVDYNYLRGDLLKTIFLTVFVVAIELVVRLLFKTI